MANDNTDAIEVLKDLVNKLDNRNPRTSGYIVNRDGLIKILESLTSHLTANVMHRPLLPGESNDWVHVELKTTFSLSREELGI